MKKFLTIALLFSTTALIAMDLERQPLINQAIVDLESNSISLDQLKEAVTTYDSSKTLQLLDDIQSQKNASKIINNFERWFNKTVNIYNLKNAAINNFVTATVCCIGAGIFLPLGGLLILRSKIYVPGTIACLAGIAFLIAAIISAKKNFRQTNQIKHYQPHKQTIDIVLNKLEQIHLINQQKQLEKK